MAKLMYFILALLIVCTGVLSISAQERQVTVSKTGIDQLSYINETKLTNNGHTQMDDFSQEVVDLFATQFKLSYDKEMLAKLGYNDIVENNKYELYFEKDSFSIILRDKLSGYMYSSRAEFQGISGAREDNTTNRHLMNSGIWVNYVNKNKVSTATIETASLYTLADVTYLTDGSRNDTQDAQSMFSLEPSSYNKTKVEVDVEVKGQSLFVSLDLKAIQVSFDVQLTLSDDGLEVYIPASSLVEYGNKYGLTSISIFPYFGSTREAYFPSYMVIPDGTGALIRLDKMINENVNAHFFGSDSGLSGSTIQDLTMPIAGLIHHVGEAGFYMHIADGAENAQLNADFWSAKSKYNKIYMTHMVRPIFRSIINKAGEGFDKVPEKLTENDFKMSYHFLTTDSSYVGIAVHYRNTLLSQDILVAKPTQEHIPMLVRLLMGEREPSFIGSHYLEMTSAQDGIDMLQQLDESEIHNQTVELLGWSKDGHRNMMPFRNTPLTSLEELVTHLEKNDSTYFLQQDYVVSSELSHRINFNRDVSRNLSRIKMTDTLSSLNNQNIQSYQLYPEQSLQLAKQDVSFFVGNEGRGISMPDIGNQLFSYYNRDIYDRKKSMSYYLDILNEHENIMLSKPNSYTWKYADVYQDMPISHSQFYYYTDLVPLLPIVLKGSIPYFAPDMNFNATSEDRLLMMVDFSMYPSYILTKQPTEKMRFTLSNVYFTTAFDTFKDDMADVYRFLDGALSQVSGAYITNREIVATGVSKVTYSNGVTIYVNYTQQPYSLENLVIPARDYEVIR